MDMKMYGVGMGGIHGPGMGNNFKHGDLVKFDSYLQMEWYGK